MLEEENSRLKGLLIATTVAYAFTFLIAIFLSDFINSDQYVIWSIQYGWVIYLSWLILFLSFCWVPMSIFLGIQGFIVRKKYDNMSFTGDRTIGNLSLLFPILFFVVYIGSRILKFI